MSVLAQAPLPAPWVTVPDPDGGAEPYYWNQETNETTWDRPDLEDEAEEHEQVQRDAQADVADVRGLYQQQVADLTTKVLDLKGDPDS